MSDTPAQEVNIDEILAEMYGIGIGKTAKSVLEDMHPDSFLAQSILEAKAKLQQHIQAAYKKGYIAGGIDEILRHEKARTDVEAGEA